MKSIFNPKQFSADCKWCFGIFGQNLIPISLAFSSQCLSLKLIRVLHVENIYRLHKGTQPCPLSSSLCHNRKDQMANSGTYVNYSEVTRGNSTCIFTAIVWSNPKYFTCPKGNFPKSSYYQRIIGLYLKKKKVIQEKIDQLWLGTRLTWQLGGSNETLISYFRWGNWGHEMYQTQAS